MKNIFLLLLFISASIQAQFQRGYVLSEIHFKNGQILNGYIFDDFAQNDWYGKHDYKKTSVISGQNVSVGYASASSSFQPIIKTIHFKINENDGQQIDYDTDSINYISVNRQGNIQKYKTLKIRRSEWGVEENIKFDTLQRTIWGPVKKEGKINMYGYFNWMGTKKNSWSEVFFQRDGNQYAINPIHSNKAFISLNYQRPQIKASLLEIFNDCPRFVNDIENIIDDYLSDFSDAQHLTKDDKKIIKNQPKENRDRFEFEIREKRSFMPYENILNKYYSYCGK